MHRDGEWVGEEGLGTLSYDGLVQIFLNKQNEIIYNLILFSHIYFTFFNF